MDKLVVRIKLARPLGVYDEAFSDEDGSIEISINSVDYLKVRKEIYNLMHNDALFLVFDSDNGFASDNIIGKIVAVEPTYADVEIYDKYEAFITETLDDLSIGMSYYCKVNSETVMNYIHRLTVHDLKFDKYYLLKNGIPVKRD